MSNPIYDLKALILGDSKPPISGRVVSSGSNGVLVRTSKGVIVSTNLTNASLQPNTRVSIQGNIITGIAADTSTLPIHRV